jgi:hypothetical protein
MGIELPDEFGVIMKTWMREVDGMRPSRCRLFRAHAPIPA